MAKEWAEAFYKSKEWQDCRKLYLLFINNLCERCLSKGDIVAATIVHHKTWLTPKNINDPSITLSFDNLEGLCLDCHNKEHHSKSACRNGFYFDESGNLRHI